MGIDEEGLNIIEKPRMPTLLPVKDHFYSQLQYLPILSMPKSRQSKMDQLTEWLTANKKKVER